MNIIQQLSSRSTSGRFEKSFEQSFLLHLHKKEFSDTVQVIRNSDIYIADSIVYSVDVGHEVQFQTQFCKSCGGYALCGSETNGYTQCGFNCQ